jgi:hypothetical protein
MARGRLIARDPTRMTRSVAFRLATLLLLVSLPAGAFEFTTTLPAPRGTTPSVDGERSAGEWDDAVRVELLGGGEMRLKHDGVYLYLLIESDRDGLASLCVERASVIAILHASAALGTAEYRGHFANAELARPFFFELRDTGASLEARKARKTFLASELWFANASRAGNSPREFQISLDIAAEHGRIPLAVAFYSPDDGTVAYWPEDLSDACRSIDVVKGQTPPRLVFAPHRWPVVTIDSVGMPIGDR